MVLEPMMKHRYPTIIAAALYLASANDAFTTEAPGDHLADHRSLWREKPLAFEENKGQVLTLEGEAAPYVRYRLAQGNTHIFLLNNGIAFQFNRHHANALAAAERMDGTVLSAAVMEPGTELLETYRMDMLLEGANPHPRISTEGRSRDRVHYNTTSQASALAVHAFTKVTYHEVWPGIDWVVYTTEKGMKYDLVVHPGADPGRIALRFKHHDELYVDAQGRLIHGNPLGRFTEERPVSFQNGKAIATRFRLEGDLLRFDLAAYDKDQTLTIDPDRIWATYFGGEAFDSVNDIGISPDGRIILSGQTSSTTGIASGGHQSTYAGNSDGFVAAFDADGAPLWRTYFGGTGYENVVRNAVSLNGEIYLAGHTSSTGWTALNGHQSTFGGGTYDAFLVKFDADGALQWGTYYGGSELDQAYNCTVDAEGQVYLVGFTASTSAISTGWYQATYGGGLRDAFLVKFGPDGARQWGTYYGGEGEDMFRDLAVDEDGNIHAIGSTFSTTGVAAGGHQNTFGGGGTPWDGLVVKFTANGTRQWGTYYGGSGSDELTAIALDGGDIYVCGATSTATNMAANGQQNVYGGGTLDALLIKFAPDGTRTWATYLGGSAFELGYNLALDQSASPHAVYLSGWTASSTAIASDGFQEAYGGGVSDAYLAKYGHDGTRLWATYYGGALTEQGVSCAVDPQGYVYLVGSTTSTSGIAESGFQTTYGGGTYDGYVAKFHGTATALAEHLEQAALAVRPNPATNELWVGTGLEHTPPARLVIRDLTGRLVEERSRAVPYHAGAFRMDIGHLVPGTYVVEVQLEQRRLTARFVKE
ncbi:MAG: hypothetical protein IPM46_08435 [Flavobacteriales bacterium]|nr:hypothetical protein [Flavobacteriales bacterium]